MIYPICRTLLPGILALILLTACSQKAQQPPIWERYGNARFAYCLWYPDNLLLPQGESENGDGQTFRSGDNAISWTVYGSHNIDRLSIEEEWEQEVRWSKERGENRVLIDKTVEDSAFVFVARMEDRFYHQKTVLRKGLSLTVSVEYPESQKRKLQEMVNKSLELFPDCSAAFLH